MILQVLIALVAGWINRHQQHVITYLKEENRVLTSKLPRGRLRLHDTERRRLAQLAHPLGRKQLKDTATIATPDTLVTVQVVITGITPPLAPSERVRAAETGPRHHGGPRHTLR
jgi:hypothetical protein